MKQGGGIGGLGRFGEPAVLVLLSLAEGPKHGYAIATDIDVVSGVRLGPGTLYGAISRLDERGLIEAVPSEDRRRPYRLTPSGAEALRGHLAMLERVTTTGQRRLAGA
ncbi:MAG: PadR family transcriptional regulator [Candidatus Dormibacter sp.]|uniref:PadR family transcriptional regulator n=1 Tax=Candidatus Dormibacter sp. TaxID=2973982 RepID=UPI000DB12BD2|nr:MAG: PadR family transcriptional regulator [Candidatus Dormibacteraeota bacterium]